jgi:DNA repair protein RecN (Recombination protein N)
MLDELSVTNLAILAEAHLEPGPGLVVVTGETGTGKTLLLGALRLLLGETSSKDQVGPAGDETTVEARFMFNDRERIAARRLSISGRSRAYLDGSMVPAAALSEHIAGSVEIVGQHDHLALAGASGLRRLVDGALDADGKGALAAYAEAWEVLVECRQQLELLGGDLRALERELDMVRFQADEIAEAGFAAGDDVVLAADAERLRNREALVEGLAAAAEALGEDGAGAALDQAAAHLRRVARHDPSLQPLAEQAVELAVLAGELATAAESAAEPSMGDGDALDAVEQRLAALGDLKRKYGASLDDVLEFGDTAARRAAELTSMLDRAEGADAALAAAEGEVAARGAALLAARGRAARKLAKRAIGHLTSLGFDDPVVHFDLVSALPGPGGADRVTLAFASDRALTPGPVAKTASGGELSRLVLALRLAAGVADADVIAFDEIDAGVGGSTALAMGKKLADLAVGRQVFCVTHLPQVAAFADSHYVVDRTGTTAAVRRVDGDDRVQEISRMLAGLAGSEKGRDHAAELLAAARGGPA